MTKQQLIAKLAEKQNVTQSKASEILEDVKTIIGNELLNGNEVRLGSNFGTFKPTSRSGKVPGTDKTYSSKSVKFSVSAPFKKFLN